MKKVKLIQKNQHEFMITLVISIFLGLFIWDLAVIGGGKSVCYHVSFWSLVFNLLSYVLLFIVTSFVYLFFTDFVLSFPIIAIVALLVPFAFIYAFFAENYEIFSNCSIIKIISNTYVFLIVSILVSYFLVVKLSKYIKKYDS